MDDEYMNQLPIVLQRVLQDKKEEVISVEDVIRSSWAMIAKGMQFVDSKLNMPGEYVKEMGTFLKKLIDKSYASKTGLASIVDMAKMGVMLKDTSLNPTGHILTHNKNVAFYAESICASEKIKTAYYVTEKISNRIKLAALLHDIGKIGIPDYILNKPDMLNLSEWNIMEQHPLYSETILNLMSQAFNVDMELLIMEVGSHHERCDGKGYPKKIAEQNIPLGGKIIAVADCFAGLTEKRVYKEPKTPQQAIEIMRADEGHFDEYMLQQAITPLLKAYEKLRKNIA